MSKCNDIYCQYRNERGYCNISGCIKPKEYGNTNFTQDVIIFPFSVGDKTFYTRKELEYYILMTQNEDYGKRKLVLMNEKELRKQSEENSKNILEILKQNEIDYLKSQLEYTENMLKYQQGLIKEKPINKTYKYVEEDFYYSNVLDKKDFYYDKENGCYYRKYKEWMGCCCG